MFLSVTAVLMLFSCAHGENPAIQVILTNKGLQYGKEMLGGVTSILLPNGSKHKNKVVAQNPTV